MSSLRDLVFNDPIVSAGLVVVLILVAYLAKRHTGPEDDWIEFVKHLVFTAYDDEAEQMGLDIVVCKNPEDYVCTVPLSVDEVELMLTACGYGENDISNEKFRILPPDVGQPHKMSEKQFQRGSMKFSEPDSDKQQHAYFFQNPVVERTATLTRRWTGIRTLVGIRKTISPNRKRTATRTDGCARFESNNVEYEFDVDWERDLWEAYRLFEHPDKVDVGTSEEGGTDGGGIAVEDVAKANTDG